MRRMMNVNPRYKNGDTAEHPRVVERRSRTFERISILLAMVVGVGPSALSNDSAGTTRDLLDSVGRLLDQPAAKQDLLRKLEDPAAMRDSVARSRLIHLFQNSNPKEQRNTGPSFTPDQIEFFENRVRPVLAQHCFSCHGPEKQKNGLRLDTRAGVYAGAESGPVLVPGDPAASKLIQAIQWSSDPKMPPSGRLEQHDIDALTEWVRIGAPWPDTEVVALSMDERIASARRGHWAFRPVVSAKIPSVNNPAWIRTPVDAFILSRLEANGITPSPPADRRTLIRRATYDLIGLPPDPEEVAAFIAEDSPDAFEKLVDRLLDSPHYGERWGRYWLDVARYADTRGYVFQSDRNIPFSHTYRDYVIRSFNEDKPYDQFVREQLAADLLDLGEDKRPLAAMGFLTLNRHFLGNVHDITDDRIDVVTRGLMGITVSCARCHEHKYDPIPTEDYYSLYGVFRSSYEPAEPPLIEEPDPNDPAYQSYVKELADAEASERALIKELHVSLLTHAREKAGDYLLAGWEARDLNEEQLKTLARDRSLRWQLVQRWREYLATRSESRDPVLAPWFAFAAAPASEFAAKAAEIGATANADPEHPINPVIAKTFEGGDPIASLSEVAKRYGAAFASADLAWRELIAAESQMAAGGSEPAAFSKALPDPGLEAVRQVLYSPDSPANVAESDVLSMYDVPTQNRVRDKRNAVARVKSTHPGRPNRAMVMFDSETPFEPYVFERGNPANKGPEVPRQFLAVLAGDARKPFEHGSGRRELADAIASNDNPLTARVLVNRVWMYHFDKPLVETPSDFGLRSEPPSHPELLDYLAHRFMAEGWSIKKLHRWIMLSSAYQQASLDRAEPRAVDPENRLIWRQNRRRLDFEATRDTLLRVAGNLDETLGGPAVEITQPPFTNRRSVYSFIERQNLPGMFRTFDFANPDTHSPRRYRTTVPQQALFMLNSPFVIEQARHFASRADICNLPDRDRVRAMYEIAFQRTADPAEIDLGLAFLEKQTGVPNLVPSPAAWQYGYGQVDEEAGKTAAFEPLPHFDGGSWKGGSNLPDSLLGWVMLDATGGHPGHGPEMAAIRRWVSPVTGTISIDGRLEHTSDKGDGVIGYIVSSRTGILWKNPVKNAALDTAVESAEIQAGDTVDFVVFCGADESHDTFGWAPRVRLQSGAITGGSEMDWSAYQDFSGPPPTLPEPLRPWEQFAQVLLASNELIFVD